jgi:hypothetical protein
MAIIGSGINQDIQLDLYATARTNEASRVRHWRPALQGAVPPML